MEKKFFSKGKVPFSMAGSLLRAVQESFSVKEIYRWKEDRFVFFMKKTIGPKIPSLSRKIKQKWSEKLKMTFLNHFHQGGHPGAGPEGVRCISRRRST